ncbi:hypothetical protein TNCV_632191 [Trichonephila clavipes]|nr:hypothetical protein TNCV_632191 [Trichonephila clavipes]
MVSTDGQQRRAPLRHGVNEAINHELGYSVQLFQKSSFQFFESLWGWLAASNQQLSKLLNRLNDFTETSYSSKQSSQ